MWIHIAEFRKAQELQQLRTDEKRLNVEISAAKNIMRNLQSKITQYAF
jgi:hypothetical protein